MSNGTLQTLSLYFPLWGASFDSDAVGRIGSGIAACVPYSDEWHTVQQTDVWMAQFRSSPRVEGPSPPCCLVVMAALDKEASVEEAVDTKGAEMLSAARNAVTALRLFRTGWFLQPELAFYVFYAPSLPNNVLRFPGPYRQAFVSGTSFLPMPGFALSIQDLTQDINAPGPIAATWQLLQEYRLSGGDTSVEIALESFNRSYGYQLNDTHRAANLFTALDAMLGGMSARKIGRVSINPRGFARRVEAALRTARSPTFSGDPHNEARWLDWKDGGRGIRNAIAHGKSQTVAAAAAESYDRLQAIVRTLLCQYLRFSVIWFSGRSWIATQLDIPPDSPLAAAYVKALEVEAKEPAASLSRPSLLT